MSLLSQIICQTVSDNGLVTTECLQVRLAYHGRELFELDDNDLFEKQEGDQQVSAMRRPHAQGIGWGCAGSQPPRALLVLLHFLDLLTSNAACYWSTCFYCCEPTTDPEAQNYLNSVESLSGGKLTAQWP